MRAQFAATLAMRAAIKRLSGNLLLAVLAIGFLGMNVQSSEAAPAWKCAKNHCFWVEGYTGPVPDYAASWGPPREPGCYYVHGKLSKKWSQYCPPSKPMQ